MEHSQASHSEPACSPHQLLSYLSHNPLLASTGLPGTCILESIIRIRTLAPPFPSCVTWAKCLGLSESVTTLGNGNYKSSLLKFFERPRGVVLLHCHEQMYLPPNHRTFYFQHRTHSRYSVGPIHNQINLLWVGQSRAGKDGESPVLHCTHACH